jgi:hypothetical protein
MNYEKDIEIKCDQLDLEWLDQAALMIKYGRISAQANLDRDKAKVELDLVKAELDKAIRKAPEKYGLEKVTETALLNAITSHSDYLSAQELYQQAEYEASVAKSAVYAFDARKTALENLVKLHGQQYFAGPRIPRDLTQEREAQQKRVDEGVGSKLKRRTE